MDNHSVSDTQKISYALYDDHPVLVSPKLAEIFGLPKAVFIQQVHYWILKKNKDPERYKDSFHNGLTWVYNSARGWANKMPYLGTERTVARFIADLKEQGILIIESYNKVGFDKTNWITINYMRLNQIVSSHKSREEIKPRNRKNTSDNLSDRCGQNDSMVMTNLQHADDKMTASCGQIYSTNTRDYTETTSEITSERSIDHSQANDRPHENQLSLFSDQEFEAELRRRTGDHSLSISKASNPDRSDLPRAACGKVDKSSEAANASQKAFDLFWEQYPRKTAKAAALKAWAKLKASSELIDTIMHDIANRKQNDHQWRDPAFVPHPATYLNGQRWTDEVVKAPVLTNQKSGVQSDKDNSGIDELWSIMRGETV